MAKRAAGWLLLLLTLALVGCDHATKAAAEATLEPSRPVALVKGVLELCYVENHDTAFSLTRQVDFPGKALVLAGVSLLVTLVIGAAAWKRRASASRAEQVAMALVASGAIGNVIDRMRLGYVVDFIHLQHWPVFNVADVLIVAGVLLLVWTGIGRTRAPSPGSAA